MNLLLLLGFYALVLLLGCFSLRKSDIARQKRRGVPAGCLGCRFLNTGEEHYSDKRYRIVYWCKNKGCPQYNGRFTADRPDYAYYDLKKSLNNMGIYQFDESMDLGEIHSLAVAMKYKGMCYNNQLSYSENRENYLNLELSEFKLNYDNEKSLKYNEDVLHIAKILSCRGLTYDKSQTHLYNQEKLEIEEKLSRLGKKYNDSASITEMKHFLEVSEEEFKQKEEDRKRSLQACESLLKSFEQKQEEERLQSEELARLKEKEEKLLIEKWNKLFTQEQQDYLNKLKLKTISFTNIPEKHMDRNFCLEAVKINGYILLYVPRSLVDREMCEEAVRNNGNAIKYVPPGFLENNETH